MKYEEKRAQIREYFEQSYFPGKKIPSEKELAALFEINLGMVREILRELETLGVVRKQKRLGNFLNSSVLRTKARLDDNCSFLALIQDQGYAVSEQTRLRTQPLSHDQQACTLLECKQQRDMICFEELFCADGDPAILSYYYCPAIYFGQVDWDAIASDSTALKEQIRQKIYPSYDHSIIHLSAGTAAGQEAERLGLPPQTSLIVWEESYYNIYDELMGVSYNYFNPNRMELAFVRKRPASLPQLKE